MTKVARNKGSYHARPSGRGWQVKYPLGWSEEKKKYDEYREDVGSESEAISLIKEINDFVYHGGRPSEVPGWRKKALGKTQDQTPLLREFAEEFIGLRKASMKVADRTIQSDRECWSRLDPYLGGKKLNNVSARDIDWAYAQMRSGGEDSSRHPYSGTTVQKSHAFLNMLMAKAVDYGYIGKNPCEFVDKPKRDTKEKTSLSLCEAQDLTRTILGQPLDSKPVGVLISLYCGLRLSEMLALTWDDYSKGCIHVNKSLNREKQTFKETKNGEARVVPCPPPLVAVLDEWKAEQQRKFDRLGLQWSKGMPIINGRTANHITQRTYTKWFASARLQYPIPNDFTFHGLRHTYVTLVSRDCGIDEETARSLSGHKSLQSFQVYIHTNNEWKLEAASRLGKLLLPNDSARQCRNCQLWTASPVDPSEGACWAREHSELRVTNMSQGCTNGCFSLKQSA